MTNTQLIAAVSTLTDLRKADVKKVLDAVAGQIRDSLVLGGFVTLSGVGEFRRGRTVGRTYQHPATGALAVSRARKKTNFIANSSLEKHLNGG